jgi:hypothetical protein
LSKINWKTRKYRHQSSDKTRFSFIFRAHYLNESLQNTAYKKPTQMIGSSKRRQYLQKGKEKEVQVGLLDLRSGSASRGGGLRVKEGDKLIQAGSSCARKCWAKQGEYLGLSILREKVGEDALQRIPHGSYALARQFAIQLKNIESVQKTVIRFLAQSVFLTHFPCWRKAGLHQHQR